MKDLGDRATGVVSDENDWGGKYPRPITPRRIVTGTVMGVYPGAPDVVKVETDRGETCVIRIRVR